MEVIHIVEVDKTKETEAGFIVTYFLTKEEFEILRDQANIEGKIDEEK
jgi:hypothetical protein